MLMMVRSPKDAKKVPTFKKKIMKFLKMQTSKEENHRCLQYKKGETWLKQKIS